MASDNKKSRLTAKNVGLTGAGIFFTSWAIPKALDYVFDTSFLAAIYGRLQGVWSWLNQQQPQPNWFPVVLVLALLLMASVGFYFFRLYSSALKEPKAALPLESETASQKLTSAQRLTLIRLAGVIEGGEMLGSITSFGRSTLFKSLDEEMALEQLELMGLVKFTNPTGTTASLRKPTLTLKGMEYVSARRKETAERKQQANDAASTS